MKIRMVSATGCAGGHCPTVYSTDQGTYLVQGNAITGEAVGLELPDGEALVEIPAELLLSIPPAEAR